MTDKTDSAAKAPRDRSPSFPFIGLSTAIDRLTAYESKFGRHPTPANKAGLAWDMKEASSQAAQTLAALKAFGMVDYSGSGPGRLANLTEDARNYLRAQQDSVKRDLILRFALTPKVISNYWQHWGAKRPIDAVCLDELVLKAKFTESAADTFLRVYDDTVVFARLTDSDKEPGTNDAGGAETPRVLVAVGDLVQAAPGGVIAFEKVRVRAVQEHAGQMYVFVEGSETGYAMSDITLRERSVQPLEPPPTLALSKVDAKVDHGEGMDRFTVDEGVVKITFPEAMSTDSVADLETFFALFIKKAKRRAGSA